MRALIAALLLLVRLAQAAGPASDLAADPALEARVQRLASELRCLVCQNQSLADSHAELAMDLKKLVREQLANGRTEEEVVAYMTQRYGDFVLYRPPWQASTWLLWAGPGLFGLTGMAALVWTLRRRQRNPGATELGPEAKQRVAALLDRVDEPADH